jgi:cysteine desulfurase family protein
MGIYLDNAATSFPKPEPVYLAVDHAMRHAGGNPGRGGHRYSLDAGREVLEAREAVARFFSITDSSRVVFTSGATEALNLALLGLLKPGDRVVTTSMEHNALVRPLYELERRGLILSKVACGVDGVVSVDDLKAACDRQTRMVALSHCSNITGSIQPLAAIAAWCRQKKILLLVDAAQSAGHLPLDMSKLDVDLLAAPGHKGLLGPAGTGFLYVRESLQLEPLIFGGTGANSTASAMPDELPERFEAGTLNVPGLAGLRAGIEFLEAQGMGTLEAKVTTLIKKLLLGLSAVRGVDLFGPDLTVRRGSVVSFNLRGMDPSEVGFKLEHEHGICVRVGLHCAPDAHRTIGTFPLGTVRVSPGIFNTDEEIESLLAAVAAMAAQSF